MIRLGASALAILGFALTFGIAHGQGSAPTTLAPRTQSPPSVEASPARILSEKSSREGGPVEKLDRTKDALATPEPIITEIYADKAVFDSAKSIGIFTGHVVVTDPRFNIQGDMLTIYISKKQSEGFEQAIVEGNVGVVRDRPSTTGGPPDHMVGRSDKAVYTAKDGRFELTGNPRVQQRLNTHVATSPDTIMILKETGQLETHGPSRTEIRQEQSAEKTPSKP